MIDLDSGEDIEICGTSKRLCWGCMQPALVRKVARNGGEWFQICCACGVRGVLEGSLESAEESYGRGDIRHIAPLRAALESGEPEAAPGTNKKYLARAELESCFRYFIERSGSFGFVYVMLDLANGETKVGGTSRAPHERWREHPRGLVPICAFPCIDWRSVERRVHQVLSEYRTGREEFFRVTAQLAIECVRVESERDRLGFSVDQLDKLSEKGF